MVSKPVAGLALASLLFLVNAHAQFATAVKDYRPGIGYATEFGSGLGFTNAEQALGAPSRVTPGPFGGPVDPFNPPYLRDQLVSLGSNGSLTVQFNRPISNDPGHPYGVDFIVFGNAGFTVTNGDFTGGGITDGTLFGQNNGAVRISVSPDNVTYYPLHSSLAPVFDGYFPTEGTGNPEKPANPAFNGAYFSGQDLAGIRALYDGSAGGTGYDLAWAQDAQGNPVSLASVEFVRFEVLSGRAEIDAIAVVPEPAAWRLGLWGGALMAWAWRRTRNSGRP